MAHKVSKINQKHLENYLRERGVPPHNQIVGDLSQLADKAEILQLPGLQTPDDVDWCKAQRTVGGCVIPKSSTIAAGEWTLKLAGECLL